MNPSPAGPEALEIQQADLLHLLYAADLFAWSGKALYALYLLLGLTTVVPLRLLDPAWLQRVIQALVANALFPVIGTCLLVLAGLFNPEDRPGLRWLDLFRRLAWIPVLGYLLLIPLQGYATLQLDAAAARPLDAEIQQLRTTIGTVRDADSIEQLGQALVKLPGSPLLPKGFTMPLASFRPQVLETLETNAARLSTLREQQAAARRLPQAIGLLHTSLSCLIIATVFAASAQPNEMQPSMLQRFLHRGIARRPAGRGGRVEQGDRAFVDALMGEEEG